jgi:hypothetical protein
MNPDTTTLRVAQEWLEAHREEGAACPCCHRISKVYFRRITRTMARSLFVFYQHEQERPLAWVQPAKLFEGKGVMGRGGDWAKLQYWELIMQNPDDKHLYRITSWGMSFVELRRSVQRIARVLNGTVCGFEGDSVTIDQILGVNIYEAEMRGVTK